VTRALLAADRCPSCQNVHGQPTGWPVCPEHGHWLYVVSGPLKTGAWTYACQARNCKHTHMQKEKATMTTDPSAALAIRAGQDFWTPKQAAALGQLFNEMPPNPDLAVFLHRCQVTGLDPFANQITMIKRGGQWKIQTEIDGFRVIRDRAAKRDGVKVSYGRTKWCDAGRNWHESWIDDDPPAACEMTVYVDDRPFPAQIRFGAFAVRLKGGELTAQWRTMGDHLIAKCAEAQALRKAFPQDMEGVTIAEENGTRPAAHFSAEHVPAAPSRQRRQPAPEPPEPDPGALKDNLAAQFHRLGIDDGDERDSYLRLLTGEEDLASLTIEQLARAVADLESCDDIGHLQYITGETGDEE